jgi:hypothetical protein
MKIKYTDGDGQTHKVTIPSGMVKITAKWLSKTQGVRLETVVSLVVPPGMQVTGVPETVKIICQTADERAGENAAEEEEEGGASKEAQAKSKVAVPGVGRAVHEKERLFKYTDDTGEHCIELPVSLTTITQEWVAKNLDWKTVVSVVIPECVTSIGKRAFMYCAALQSVLIPGGVTRIGGHAFWCCSALQSVVIQGGVTTIGSGAFSCCSALQSVVIPDSVRTIGSGAFYGCSALQSVVIPGGVTRIEDSAFEGCANLCYMLAPAGLDLARVGIPDTAQVIPYDPAIMQLPLSARIVEASGLYNQIVDERKLTSAEEKLKLQDELRSLFFSIELILKPALRQLALLSRVKVLSEGGELMTGQLLKRVYQHMTENYNAICKGEEGRADSVQAWKSLTSLFSGLGKQGNVPMGPVSDIMSFVGPELNFLMGSESPSSQEERVVIGGGASKS